MRDPHYPGQPGELDDVDRLFARLERAPVPEALTAAVLASTVARPSPTRTVLAWPWMVVGLAALGLLSLAGYQIGASLAANHGLDLLTALLDDIGLFTTAPGDVVAALSEVIPWSLVALGLAGVGALVVAAGHIVSRAPAPGRPLTA